MKSVEIISVNLSKERGVMKNPIDSIILNNEGVEGDGHAGKWHKQVSLIDVESYQKSEKLNHIKLSFGSFAENITTKGMEFHKVSILDRFENNEVVLEVTQIGKKHHTKTIKDLSVDSMLPLEGVFARVISGGELKKGGNLKYIPKVFMIKVITLSDRASEGIYEDISGKLIAERTETFFAEKKMRFQVDTEIIPDEKEKLKNLLEKSFKAKYDIIFTTGSTGIGTRDIAPEIILPFIEKQIPGIMEMIRVKYGMEKPNALLSRSIAGIKGKTLLFALPGNPKAVTEYLNEIFKVLHHTILMLYDINDH